MDFREKLRLKQKAEREGLVVESHNGSVAKLIEYVDSMNCLIEVGSGYRYWTRWLNFRDGSFRDPYVRTKIRSYEGRDKLYGVGVYDTEEQLHYYHNGKIQTCEFYERWRGMIRRCYSEAALRKKPSYKGVTVCDEWLYFTKFRDWMEKQQWEGMHLDKDIIKRGNRTYCPDYCSFVDAVTNSFVAHTFPKDSDYPVGVTYNKRNDKYTSRCNNPFSGKREWLGFFDDPMEAHKAWQTRKHELACQLAEEQSDGRVAKALRERYAPNKDWTKA